jgi:hypothetical protein
MSEDVVQRLRESVRACRAVDRSALLAEAAGEIERLRLTKTEWDAISFFGCYGNLCAFHGSKQHTATLIALLERMK